MKLASFTYKNMESFGVVTDDGVIDLKKRLNNKYKDLKTYLENNGAEKITIDIDKTDYSLDQIEFLPVISNPDKIICVGLNYHEHVKEVGRDKSEEPVIFLRVANSQTGHQNDLLLPYESSMLDYEGEIAVIIGKKGRRIQEKAAMDYVAGYSCYNDGSIRDWQLRNDQWTPGKNFDGTGSFGPWMVTRGEIKDEDVLIVETRVNGEVMQKSTTEMLIFPIKELIAFISTFTTLHPGDVIVIGTPGGVGMKREPQTFLKDGDTVEIEVSKIGTLVNKVKAE